MSRKATYELFWPLRHCAMNAMNSARDACRCAEDEAKAMRFLREMERCFYRMLDEARLLEDTLGIDRRGVWSLSAHIYLETRTFSRTHSLSHGCTGEFPWHGDAEEQEVLNRLFEHIETVCFVSSPADEKVAVRHRIILDGRNQQPIIRGRKKALLNPTQYLVVKSLLEAGPIGLSKKALEKLSATTDAVNVLKRIAKRDEDWAAVIHLAKTAGRRYRIF